MSNKSFAKKYGLEGKGHKVNVSETTRYYVKELYAQSKRYIDAGLFWAKTCKLRFGNGNSEEKL